MPTRRDALLMGSALAAFTLAPGASVMRAFAQNSVPVRRSLATMKPDDPDLSAFREAVGILKGRSSGPVTWQTLYKIHGDGQVFNHCPHGNWYFLPWHRAFVVTYERVVRDVTGKADFAVPYWDWSADRNFPAVFAEETYNGQPNPLFDEGRTLANISQPLPDEWVGPQVMDQIANEPAYDLFGSFMLPGQDSLDLNWVSPHPWKSSTQGLLERTPHNQIHNWIGGDMPTAQSPRDAIFQMHHGNIDRIWAEWNHTGHENPSAYARDPNGQPIYPAAYWADMVFTDNFFYPDGTPWSPKVTDLEDTEALGYRYDFPEVPQALLMALGSRGDAVRERTLAALADRATGAAAGTTVTPVEGTARLSEPLSITVPVARATISAIAAAPRGSSRLMMLAAPPPRPRVLAIIRDIAYTNQESTSFNVFLDRQGLDPSVSTDDAHYVGSVSFFGPSGHGDHGGMAGPGVVLDLTDAIARIYGPRADLPDDLTLQVQPVPLGPADGLGDVGTFTPASVEIITVPA